MEEDERHDKRRTEIKDRSRRSTHSVERHPAGRVDATPTTTAPIVFDVKDLAVYYGSFRAVRDVKLTVRRNEVTAFIGPSGCGKTTVLRCFNRMNDLIDEPRVEGTLTYHGIDLYGPKVNPVEVRRRIGMVFQKPNPFPKSIYDNVAYGPRIGGQRKATSTTSSRQALPRAALWDEVKDRLKKSALGLSGGQQQRLVHRSGDRRRSRGDPHGRALLRARPHRHRSHRGSHGRDQGAVHDRDRHPQHAAGGAASPIARRSSPRRSTRRATCARACSSRSTAPRRSSPTRSDERTENYVTGRFG